jgi:hypothetical protein
MTQARTWFAVVWIGVLALGCHSRELLDPSADGVVTITGRLVAVKDDRPVDGGVDLTLTTEAGSREILRVGSAFIAGPRDSVLALHRVVDAAKVGDRLRGSGRRDSAGAVIVERLEILD